MFDLEFTGLHKLSTPISIGLVAEDGKEFYAEFTDYDEMQLNDWLVENVMNHLVLGDYDFVKDYKPEEKLVLVKGDTEIIAQTLSAWLDNYKEDGIEMWGDCLAWDWVLFVSIFGNAFDIPKHIFYLPMDLSTALKLCRQDPDLDRLLFVYEKKELIPKSDIGSHNSLYDARIQMEVYKKILSLMDMADNNSLVDTEEPSKDLADEKPLLLDEITSDVKGDEQSVTEFIEPNQDMVNEAGEEWNPPV